MDHGLAQVFRVGLPACLPECDFMGRSVVFQNQRMIDGDVRRPLFKVTDRIAARGHHIAQQQVGFCDRTGGPVDKARLDSAPGIHEARAISCRERPDMQSLDSLQAVFEAGFPMPPVAAFLHGASIFSASELGAQLFRVALPVQKQRGDACQDNHCKSND